MRLDFLVIGLYMAGTMWIGWRVSDEARNVEGYTVGNRNMPGWIVGMSVLGAFLSSITFLALPADVYKSGTWNPIIFGAMAPIAAWIAVVWLVPLYRRKARLSAYELLETRFGYWARAYAALSFVALQLLRTGMVTLLVGVGVEPMLDWKQPPDGWFATQLSPAEWTSAKVLGIILVSGVVVIIYDVMGGIRAVIWTDIVQVSVLSFGAIWILAELTLFRPGGFAGLVADFPTDRMSLGQWLNFDERGAWDWGIGSVLVMVIYGFTENLRNYGADQQYVQRMLASSDDIEARRAIWIGALGYQPLNLIFCLIGTALILHVNDGVAAGSETAIEMSASQAERVLPMYIRLELPEVVAGLVVAAILAAAMSTTDSSMNSSSMVVYYDLVKRLWRGGGWMREILALRLWTIAIGLLGTGMAVALYLGYGQDGSRTLMRVWWQYAGVAGGGMFGLFILAWTMRRVSPVAAAVGVLVSIPILGWGMLLRDLKPDSIWYSFRDYQCPIHPNLIGAMGTAIVVLVGAAGSVVERIFIRSREGRRA